MLYADDLALTANDPVQLQKTLRRLEPYAARKGLTVNTQNPTVNFSKVPARSQPTLTTQELQFYS